jgi:hypothetical protein
LNAPLTAALFFGSSRISGKRCPDLEEEVRVIAEAISHSLDDFDLVVDPFDQIRAERVSAMGKDAGQVRSKGGGEAAKRLDATT